VKIHTRITVSGTYNGYSGSPAATADILPLGTQQGPGATRLINVSPQANISHQEAYDAVRPMLDAFADVFEPRLFTRTQCLSSIEHKKPIAHLLLAP
jgi:hypothetical protein